VALECFEAHNPAGLLIRRLRDGDHMRHLRRGEKRTGWRWVRGTHSGTYVRDPKGTDVLPPGYDLGAQRSSSEDPWDDMPKRIEPPDLRAIEGGAE
jgi:hypothetical protein